MICQKDTKLEGRKELIITELNLQHNLQKFRQKRRRHSAIDPMDVRDFLEPDKYHRYENIVSYLKVIYHFLSY